MEMTRLLALLSTVAMSSAVFSNTVLAQSSSRPDYRSQQTRAVAQQDSRSRPVARTAQPKPIVTRTPDFSIPLTVDNSVDIAEVRLYASADQGRNWKLYDRRRPDAKGFQFRAPNEGDFWFAVRTANRNGQLISRAPLAAELKVTVDTRKPQFDVRVNVDASGKAVAEWVAQDRHLASHTFRLQYQDDNGNWQPVRVLAPDQDDRRQQWRGQTDWWVRSSGRELLVRAEIMDEGKNVSRINKRISLAGGANANTASRPRFQEEPGRYAEQGNRNWDTNNLDRGNLGRESSDASRYRDSTRSNDRIATRPIGARPNANGSIATRPIGYNRQTATRPNANGTQRVSAVGGSFSDLANGVRSGVKNWFGGVKHSEDTFGATQGGTSNIGFERPRNLDTINPPTKSPVFAPVSQQKRDGFGPPSLQQFGQPSSQLGPRQNQQQFGDQTPFADSKRTQQLFNQRRDGLFGQQTQPPGRTSRPRITSSPNFEIDYDLKGVGSKGARVVELWFTRDDGRTWELYGSDADRRSPMEVRLKNEGMYGFRLAVHGYDSPAPKAPQENDPADIWVAADWTKPVGRITRAVLTGSERKADNSFDSQFGEQSPNVMSIEWVAEDTLLDPHPITLSYSESAEGPWTPIASALDNSGAHDWRIDRKLPERLFLQLEVRDIAGNITSAHYDASDASLGGTPAGKILDIRPLDESASRDINFR